MTALAQDGSSCGRCVVGLPFNEATFSNESLSNEAPCATWYLYGSTFSYSFEGKAAIFPQLLVTKKKKGTSNNSIIRYSRNSSGHSGPTFVCGVVLKTKVEH